MERSVRWTAKQSVFLRIQVRASSKQKVWNEAENTEQDWGETVRLLRHALPISLLILREKPTVLQSKRSQAS